MLAWERIEMHVSAVVVSFVVPGREILLQRARRHVDHYSFDIARVLPWHFGCHFSKRA